MSDKHDYKNILQEMKSLDPLVYDGEPGIDGNYYIYCFFCEQRQKGADYNDHKPDCLWVRAVDMVKQSEMAR